jgi:hypothetical protein
MVCDYLEVFLNIPKKPDARILRGTGVTCESESDSTDWEADEAGLDNLGSSLVGETLPTRLRCSTTGDVRAGLGGVLIAGNRSVWMD